MEKNIYIIAIQSCWELNKDKNDWHDIIELNYKLKIFEYFFYKYIIFNIAGVAKYYI